MCSRGYYDLTSGLAASTVLIAGLVCATPIGYILHRTGKRLVFCLRMMSIIFVVSLALQAYYLRLPGATVGIFASLGLFGAIALGQWPLPKRFLGSAPIQLTKPLAWHGFPCLDLCRYDTQQRHNSPDLVHIEMHFFRALLLCS